MIKEGESVCSEAFISSSLGSVTVNLGVIVVTDLLTAKAFTCGGLFKISLTNSSGVVVVVNQSICLYFNFGQRARVESACSFGNRISRCI